MFAMTYTFKLSRRIARIRAPMVAAAVLFSLAGCNATDTLTPDDNTTTELAAPGVAQLAATSGGIPFGTADQPIEVFSQFHGALRIISPSYLLENLATIKAQGGRVMLDLAGAQRYWTDASGHFSMTKWKERVNRYKNVNFSSYIDDGTIIGHYLIDEPNDPTNWNGQMVPGSTVEEMAKYSKQLWPKMATAVRAEPAYMAEWSGTYQYLDAAWAQYVSWKGSAADYLSKNVAAAQKKGLNLVVGLNVTKGGIDGAKMTPSQVQSWGSAMLASTYPCAFLSWKYGSDLLAGSMKTAMISLQSQAQNRSSKSCRIGASAPAPAPAPSPSPSPSPSPTPVTGSLPFGLVNTPMEAYSTEFTGTVYVADPSYIKGRLAAAQSSSMRMIVRLVGTAQSKNADGTFSLTKWKAQIDRYRSLGLGSYVTGGTFYLHDVVDNPSCASCWGGKPISWETVEEMARYSKSIWPSLPTATWVAPSKLAGASFRWTYLDAGWIQYNTSMGDLRSYLAGELNQAGQEGLGLVVGLNLQHAGGVNTAPMTASQIKAFGTILASSPSACAMAAYRYDAAYLSQTGIRQALDSVASVAKRRTAGSCVGS
jgi:hypothetical protein